MMDELIQAMSNSDLEDMKAKFSDNASVVKLIDGILEGRVKAQAEADAKLKFEAGVAKFFNGTNSKGKPYCPHPEDIHNIYVRWALVEVEDTSGDGEEVTVIITPAVVKEGEIVTDAVTEVQTRYPKMEVWQWVVEVNHKVKADSGSDAPKSSKRAITVFKRNGTQLEDKGHFASASKACEALGLTIGGDSATRVLSREGYITDYYEGTDFQA